MSFEVFENHWEIDGVIRPVTPIRIGKPNAEYSLQEASVLLQYDAARDRYTPFIPGSSLKGVLRASVERILRTHGMENRMAKNLFGDMEKASKARVRDCRPANNEAFINPVDERPHVNPKFKNNRMYPNFRVEEVVPPMDFKFHIDLDNATEEEVSWVLVGLMEFNHKRAQIGGASSRGNGFVNISVDSIREITNDGLSLVMKERVSTWQDVKTFEKKASRMAPVNPSRPDSNGPFAIYEHANTSECEGTVVMEMTAICETEFKMPGVETDTVLMNGRPVIPGSTIKGHLRKELEKMERRSRDDLFGSTDNRRGHRSRILVSDFVPSMECEPDRIPKGTDLKGWVVFDSVGKKDIQQVMSLLESVSQITGNTAARAVFREPPVRNKVSFSIKQAYKYSYENPQLDVTNRITSG